MRATPCFIEIFEIAAWFGDANRRLRTAPDSPAERPVGPVSPASPKFANIRHHKRAFRGWQGGIGLPKPRHPLISLEIVEIITTIRPSPSCAAPMRLAPNLLASPIFEKTPMKQEVARCRKSRATPRLPATPLRVVRLISLRIYACVADEKETIHAQASETER